MKKFIILLKEKKGEKMKKKDIIFITIIRTQKIQALFIWASILTPMIMDYSLTANELSFLLLTVFTLFLLNPNFLYGKKSKH